MANQHEVKIFRAKVTQSDIWRADVDGGGQIATADSLADLRRKVVSSVRAIQQLVPHERVEIEWVYALADGAVRVEIEELPPADRGAKDETAARVGWHQRRVDDYIRERHGHRRPAGPPDPAT